MSTVRVTYPITENVHRLLRDYPEIAKSISIPETGRSELEIVRLLNNTHYDLSRGLLDIINEWLPLSGPIGRSILKTTKPFESAQRVAEMLLFAHLYECFGKHVEAPESGAAPVCPDLIVHSSVGQVRIELYTPVDFVGLQLLEKYLSAILKYLEISGGFELVVNAGPKLKDGEWSQDDVFYAYTLPKAETELHAWLIDFQSAATSWLSNGRPASDFSMDGPGGETEVRIACEDFCDNDEDRLVRVAWGTRSTDSQLFFDIGTAEENAWSEWGKKLRTKLFKRQCGGETEGVLRLLVVNFSMAETGWPHFISESWFTERFKEIIQVIMGDQVTYDAILPAQIYSNPCFGVPVLINPRREEMLQTLIKEAGMDRQCEPPPEQSPEEVAKMLEEMLGEHD